MNRPVETLVELAKRRAAEMRNADSRRISFIAQQPKKRAQAHDRAIRDALVRSYNLEPARNA